MAHILHSLAKILLGLIIIFGLSLFKSVIENNIFQSSILKSLITIAFLFFSCFIVVLANKYLNKIEFRDSNLSFKNIHLNFIKGAALFIPVIFFPVIFILIVNQDLQLNDQGFKILLSVGISALLVSIFEEFIFRGFVSQTIFISTGNLIITSVISTMIFVLVHLSNIIEAGNLVLPINLFFAGILFNYLFFYYSSIWVPVGLHFANNLFWQLIDADLKNTDQLPVQVYEEWLTWIYTAGIIITTLVFMVKYHKLNIRKLLLHRAF